MNVKCLKSLWAVPHKVSGFKVELRCHWSHDKPCRCCDKFISCHPLAGASGRLTFPLSPSFFWAGLIAPPCDDLRAGSTFVKEICSFQYCPCPVKLLRKHMARKLVVASHPSQLLQSSFIHSNANIGGFFPSDSSHSVSEIGQSQWLTSYVLSQLLSCYFIPLPLSSSLATRFLCSSHCQ